MRMTRLNLYPSNLAEVDSFGKWKRDRDEWPIQNALQKFARFDQICRYLGPLRCLLFLRREATGQCSERDIINNIGN